MCSMQVTRHNLELDLPDDVSSLGSATPRGWGGGRLPRETFLPPIRGDSFPPPGKPILKAARADAKLAAVHESPALPASDFGHKKPRLRMDKTFFEIAQGARPSDASKGKFKSLAIASEITMMETKISESLHHKADRDTPSAASAMTCLEVLADLSRQPSPMQKVFQDLHQEFQVAILSNKHMTYSSVTNTIERVPYFEVLRQIDVAAQPQSKKSDEEASSSELTESLKQTDVLSAKASELQASVRAKEEQLLVLNQQLQLERYKRQRVESDLQEVLADRSELQRQRTHSVPKPKFDLKVAQVAFLSEALRKLREAHDEMIRDIVEKTKDGSYNKNAKALQHWVEDVASGAKALQLQGMFHSAVAMRSADVDEARLMMLEDPIGSGSSGSDAEADDSGSEEEETRPLDDVSLDQASKLLHQLKEASASNISS